MKKNMIRICGRNLMTAPTPAMMPSVINERRIESGIACLTSPLIQSKPEAIASAGAAPAQNTI